MSNSDDMVRFFENVLRERFRTIPGQRLRRRNDAQLLTPDIEQPLTDLVNNATRVFVLSFVGYCFYFCVSIFVVWFVCFYSDFFFDDLDDESR
jgi:hypothetical protein